MKKISESIFLILFVLFLGFSIAQSQAPTYPRYQRVLPPNYHGQFDTWRYNPMEEQWQRAEPGTQLKYNVMEDRWEYRQPKYQFRYNPFEGKWE